VSETRREEIGGFHNELARLEAAGVISLDSTTRERIRDHHESVLRSPASETRDAGSDAARLSAGMRIATVLGAVALSAAYALLIDSVWTDLSLMLQLALVSIPPVVLAWGTGYAARREPSLYIASIIATVAIIAFAVDLIVIGSIFDLSPSRHAFLAVGAVAMALAYGYRLEFALAFGIAGIGIWLWSLTSIGGDFRWTASFEHLEPLALIGGLAMLVASRLPGPASFANEYRGMGAMAVAGALLILGQTARASLLPLDSAGLVEGIYQIVGAIGFCAMIVIGLKRNWPELTRTGVGALLIFLFLRLVDWFWAWLPKWLFFLVVGLAAIGAIIMLRRARTARMEVA